MLRVLADAEVADAPIFFADPSGARTVVVLESLVAIFHAPSGMTHLLAPPAPEIMHALAMGPADAATILQRLAPTHDVDGDVNGGGAEAAIAARLGELEASGLIRRA